MVRRFFSNTDGQTMMFALPPSSSNVMSQNITPFAEPGICRTSTKPATESATGTRFA